MRGDARRNWALGLTGERSEEIGEGGLAEVPGPVQRGRLVVFVDDAGVGVKLDQSPGEGEVAVFGGDMQRGVPGLSPFRGPGGSPRASLMIASCALDVGQGAADLVGVQPLCMRRQNSAACRGSRIKGR